MALNKVFLNKVSLKSIYDRYTYTTGDTLAECLVDGYFEGAPFDLTSPTNPIIEIDARDGDTITAIRLSDYVAVGLPQKDVAANVQTLADAVSYAEVGMSVGSIVTTVEYNSGTGIGGNTYQKLDAGSSGARPAEDGGSVIHLTGGSGGLFIKGLFLNGVFIEQFGAVQSEVTDSSVAIQAAINYVETTGRLKVKANYGTFIAHNLEIPSGLKFISESGYQRNVSGVTNGAILKRTLDLPIMKAVGVSILDGSPAPITSCEFYGIRFDGNDYSTFLSDLIELTVFYTSSFTRCMFSQSSGRLIKMTECFDCRFNDCRFEWGGNVSGTIPAIDLISNGGYEATNQIHFNNCVGESLLGTAIKTTDADGGGGTYRTNEIYFNQTKIECNSSDVFLLDFEYCVGVHFNLLQVTCSGTAANVNGSIIRFKNASKTSGVIHAEISAGGATWDAYATVVASTDIDISLTTYGQSIVGDSAINHDGANANKCRVKTIGYGTFASPYPIGMPELITNAGAGLITGCPNAKAGIKFTDDARAPSESWTIGDITSDGGGSKVRILHNGVEVFRIQNDNKAIFIETLRSDVSIKLKEYTVAGAGVLSASGRQGQIIYITDETGGQVPAFSDGTAWRRMTDRAIIS